MGKNLIPPPLPTGRRPTDKDQRTVFDAAHLDLVYDAVALSEELVANFYKMSTSQWRRLYDVRTLSGLHDHEIADGPFAQIIRYEARPRDAALSSAAYDFYKVCIQDHSIMAALSKNRHIRIYPFMLYIVTHELIHVIRFCKFLQFFDAAIHERHEEECLVHRRTHEILATENIEGIKTVFDYFARWRDSGALLDDFR